MVVLNNVMVLPTELPGKRSIDYPAKGKPYNIPPSLERRDLCVISVDGSPYTVVRAYPTSIQILGTRGDIRKTLY